MIKKLIGTIALTIIFLASKSQIDTGFSTEIDFVAPTLDVLNSGTVSEGDTLVISNSLLSASDDSDDAENIFYEITNYTTHGRIVDLSGDNSVNITSFSQSKVDLGNIIYIHNGTETTSDKLGFYLEDASGNASSSYDFMIDITLVDDDVPVIKNNNVVFVQFGESATITSSTLLTEDASVSSSNITYSIVSAPTVGSLSIGGNSVTTFTQEDIDNNTLVFNHSGIDETFIDIFTFTVSDGTYVSDIQSLFIGSYTDEITMTLSEMESTTTEITTFPNPIEDSFQVAELQNEHTIEVFGIDGKLKSVERNGNSIQAQNLSSGAYIIIVKGMDGQVIGTSKFIKK